MRILQELRPLRMCARLQPVDRAMRKWSPQCGSIIADVRRHGDRAVLKYAAQWDDLPGGTPLKVSKSEIRAAGKSAQPDFTRALRTAAASIRRFCEMQKPAEWTRTRDGISVGQIVRPLNSVGCYVPGGRYPLVSTLLMTVIPAQVAGVKNIRVASPQSASRRCLRPRPCWECGKFIAVGGAQAIAALAYGTDSIPRVDKIVGPGNLYVTAAKKEIAFDCSIDFLAGPTEGIVVSDTGHARVHRLGSGGAGGARSRSARRLYYHAARSGRQGGQMGR